MSASIKAWESKSRLAYPLRDDPFDRYGVPARAMGLTVITIRAGDIHREMNLANAMPAVCSAIGSNKFEQIAQVRSINRNGPANGANVYFEFGLSPDPLSMPEVPVTNAPLRTSTLPREERRLDLADALVLVACVKSKRTCPAPARSLYTSAWFSKTRNLVEACGARWFVLSALYGLVPPDAEIAQQQPGSGSLSFSSQLGPVDVNRLPVVSGARETNTSPEPTRKPVADQVAATSKAASGHEDILAAIERLAGLHARGILTEAEFTAKKAELLERL